MSNGVAESAAPLDLAACSAAFDDIDVKQRCSVCTACKLALGLVLVPLRFVAYFAFILLHILCCRIAIIGCDVSPTVPLPRWRSRLIRWSGFVFGRLLLWSMGIFVRRRGFQHLRSLQSSTLLLVANHSSHFDPLVLMAEFMPSFVAVGRTSERKRPALIALPIVANHGLLVDQTQSTGAAEQIAKRTNPQLAAKGLPPLLIFPEGTTTNGSCLLRFARGAFVSGRPVLPVVIRYPYRHMNPATAHDVGGRKLPHLCWLFAQLLNRVEVEVLPLHTPAPEERADPQRFADAVREEMARALSSGGRRSQSQAPASSSDSDTAATLRPLRLSPLRYADKYRYLETLKPKPSQSQSSKQPIAKQA